MTYAQSIIGTIASVVFPSFLKEHNEQVDRLINGQIAEVHRAKQKLINESAQLGKLADDVLAGISGRRRD